MTGDAADGVGLEPLADRIRYAPDRVDPDAVVDELAAAEPEERATIAAAIGSIPAERAGAFADAVPLFVESMDADDEADRHPFLEALDRIAAADPAAVRPVVDRLVTDLTAFNIWVNRAAAEALQHVVTAYPEELARIEPLFDHEQKRVQARAMSVLAAATARDPTVASGYLGTCVAQVRRNSLARGSAIAVLARAGWLDPAALDPAVERLVAVVRDEGSSRGSSAGSGRGSTDGASGQSTAARGSAASTRGGGESSRGPTGSDDQAEGSGSRSGRRSRVGGSRGSDPDESETRRLALVSLTHVAGHDPAAVQSVVPLCVELTAGDDEGIVRAAARLLVTLALQDPATAGSLGDVVEGTYFDRRATIEALADASAGLPGRELLFAFALDDETRFLRFEAYRQVAGIDA